MVFRVSRVSILSSRQGIRSADTVLDAQGWCAQSEVSYSAVSDILDYNKNAGQAYTSSIKCPV